MIIHIHGKTPRVAIVGMMLGIVLVAALSVEAHAQRAARSERARAARAESKISYPPELPDGVPLVTVQSDELLKPTTMLEAGVTIATAAPRVDFMYYPGQTYPGKPWSNWGDGCATDGKYYSAIGDHLAIGVKGDDPARTGTGYVFEYDAETRTLRQLVDVAAVLNLPEGYYTPGKIHSRLDMGSDGWLYFSTHRGSDRASIDANHYEGDWILRCRPDTGEAEIVAHGPIPKHSIPASVLDPDRLIFYGGTAAGPDAVDQRIQFFAYDVKNRKLLYSGPDGPSRYLIFARSTGRVYFLPTKDDGPLVRYDPQSGGPPVNVGGRIGLRAATQETPQGYVYTASLGQRQPDVELWSFNTKTEEIESLGSARVGTESYIASLDVDPTGRYLYYVPGAHGKSDNDGSPVVQFDVVTRTKKVIAFLHPYFQEHFGCTLKGTYSTAVDARGDKLYITWNVSRGSRAWDSCGLCVVHIPESERRP